ncbi:hypothetical protein [Bacillus pumilus]|uniref:hypothetical protein n=1 Tax=Bacillus pumilus TaxID=1408 RepID=UPI00119FEB85|nr:hypothetical protein [Bacillus pumilus]
MDAKKMAEMLDDYENKAYKESFGLDWLVSVGEEIKHYMNDCYKNDTEPTIEALMQRIQNLHIEAMK